MCSKSKGKPPAAAPKSDPGKKTGGAAAVLFGDDDDNEDADLFAGKKAAEAAKKGTKVWRMVGDRLCRLIAILIIMCVLCVQSCRNSQEGNKGMEDGWGQVTQAYTVLIIMCMLCVQSCLTSQEGNKGMDDGWGQVMQAYNRPHNYVCALCTKLPDTAKKGTKVWRMIVTADAGQHCPRMFILYVHTAAWAFVR